MNIKKICPLFIKEGVYRCLSRNVFLCSKALREERKEVFSLQKKIGMKSIPIFLISYNRLSYLKDTINELEKRGYRNIIIIDNNSTYIPLLEYYKTINYKIYFIESNQGFRVFWKDERFRKYRDSFYVISDPDIVPIRECPDDFLKIFFELLEKYPYVQKVGFSLKIDDLPDDSELKEQVIGWEKKFYKHFIGKDNVFLAGIDTTFALYVPDMLVKSKLHLNGLRTGYPYQARHLPWYKSSKQVTEEDIFYSEHKTNGWWDVGKGAMTQDNRINRKRINYEDPGH